MAKVWINPAFKDKFPAKEAKKEKPPPKKPEKEEEPVSKKPETEKKVEKKKEEKPRKKTKKKKRGAESRTKLEAKLLQYLEDNKIPIEIKFIGGKAKLTGTINWFSDWQLSFKPKKKNSKDLIFHRLRLIYYKPLEEISISSEELLTMSRIIMEKEIIERLGKRFPVDQLESLTGKILTEEKLEEEINKLDFTEVDAKEIINQVKIASSVSFAEKREMQRFKDDKVPLVFHLTDNTKLKGTLEWYETLVYNIRSLDGKEEYNIPKGSVIYIEEGDA